MKLFIDSANLDEIKQAVSWGILDGCTTNPTLAAKNGVNDFLPIAKQILKLVPGPVSLEVVATDYDGMMQQGGKLAKLAPNVVVKLPITTEGLKACRDLTKKKIKVNMTLCFSPNQALLVAKMGAAYVSPFVGRLDDIGDHGNEMVEETIAIYANYRFTTQVLYASVRSPLHVKQAALMGADIATCPFNVLEKLVKHPLTDKGLDSFLSDWKKSGLKPLV